MRIPFFGRKESISLVTEIVGATDVGLKRKKNEDNFLVVDEEKSPANIGGLLVVADGMGGHVDGDVASQMAVDCVKRLVLDRLADQDHHSSGLRTSLVSIIEDVNTEIHTEGQNRNQSVPMGTTCTAVLVSLNQAFIAHVGDSRAYLFRGGDVTQLPTAHTWVQQQVSEGSITPQQARVHPRRNVITQALGIDQEINVESLKESIEVDDILLLCSDGLHGLVEDEYIASVLNDFSIEEAKQALIDKAKEEGGDDNITVVIAKFNKSEGI